MIDVICPTRMRPEYAGAMAESAMALACGNVNVTLGVDSDDPRLDEYKAIQGVSLVVAPPSNGCVKMINTLAEQSTADDIMFVGDDCIFHGDCWDCLMLEKMPSDGIGVVSPKDYANGNQVCYHWMVTRKWYDAVGWFVYPKLNQYFTDPIISFMAKKLNRMFFSDALVEHRHYARSDNPIPEDDVYRQNESHTSHDRKVYVEGKRDYLDAVERLRGLMDE